MLAFQAWRALGRDGVVGPATTHGSRRPSVPPRAAPVAASRCTATAAVALLVSGGETVRAIHVSTGAPGSTTPPGSYKVFRKELRSWSVPFSTWLPYASYFNNASPSTSTPTCPPTPPRTAACGYRRARRPRVYEFATIGTVVDVF